MKLIKYRKTTKTYLIILCILISACSTKKLSPTRSPQSYSHMNMFDKENEKSYYRSEMMGQGMMHNMKAEKTNKEQNQVNEKK